MLSRRLVLAYQYQYNIYEITDLILTHYKQNHMESINSLDELILFFYSITVRMWELYLIPRSQSKIFYHSYTIIFLMVKSTDSKNNMTPSFNESKTPFW